MAIGSQPTSQCLSDADRQAITLYSQEFIEAARFGELDDLQLMFQHPRLKELIDYANLVDTESLTSPLMYASANGYLDCVEYLVDTVGVSVSHANQSGNTALHWASLNGHLEVVDFLILKNSNVFAKNIFGKTPFDEAFVRDKKDCCERIAREECRILKEHGDEDEDEMRDDDPPNVRTNIDSIPE